MDKKGTTAGTEVIPEKDKAAAKEAVTEETKKAGCAEEVVAVPEAPKQDPEPEIIFQYREYEASMDVVTDRVKAHYYAKDMHRVPLRAFRSMLSRRILRLIM